jgi:hypothetical protein
LATAQVIALGVFVAQVLDSANVFLAADVAVALVALLADAHGLVRCDVQAVGVFGAAAIICLAFLDCLAYAVILPVVRQALIGAGIATKFEAHMAIARVAPGAGASHVDGPNLLTARPVVAATIVQCAGVGLKAFHAITRPASLASA